MVRYGYALSNGIVLGNNEGKAKAIAQRGIVQCSFIPRHGKRINLDFVRKVPFVRGLFDVIFDSTKIFIGIVIFFLFEITSDCILEESSITVVAAVAVMIVFLYHNRFTFQYHACEHMVVNAYECGVRLVVENVKVCSRVHRDCGTNWAVCIVPLTGIGILLFDYVSIVLLVAWILTYEICRVQRVKEVIEKLGALVQENITTKPPTDNQIMLAIKCMKTLVENTNE